MSPVGDKIKYGDIDFEVIAEGSGQRVLTSTDIPLFGFGGNRVAGALGKSLKDGSIRAVVAPDHSGTVQYLILIQDISCRHSLSSK